MMALLIIGCGDTKTVEDVLGNVFVMDDGKSKKTTADIDLSLTEESDKEEVVVSRLNSLQEADLEAEKSDEFIKALRYASLIVSRSNLVPESKRSQCQCHYAYSTFEVAVKTQGELLMRLKKQNIETLVKEESKKYQKLYAEFDKGIKMLIDISKLDPSLLTTESREENTQIEKIKDLAKKYADQLRPKKADDKEGEKKKDK